MFLSSCVSDVTVWGIRWDLSWCSVTEYSNKLPDRDYALLGASFSIEDAKYFLSCSPTLKIIKLHVFKPSEQVSIFCIFQTGAEVSVSVRRSEREIDAKGFAACHSPVIITDFFIAVVEDQTVSILQNSYFSPTRWKLLTSFLETLDYCYYCKEKRKDIFVHLIWKCTYLDAIDCMLACDNVSMHQSIYACCKTFL